MKKSSLAIAAMVSLVACERPATDTSVATPATEVTDAGAVALSEDGQRILYALGVVLGDRVPNLGLSEDESRIVAAGMVDAIGDQPLRIEMEDYFPLLDGFVNERLAALVADEKLAAAAFADEVAAEPGAERLPSGVVFASMVEGTGASPAATDAVTVHYHGTLRDGSVFDSSVNRGTPATFRLNEVIPCWTEGVQRIKVGGKATLLCPSDTAYGDQGTGDIPGGAALLFEVELLSVGDEP